MKNKITKIQETFKKDLDSAKTVQDIDIIKSRYLSKKNGQTAKLLQKLAKLSATDKKTYGPLINTLKNNQRKSLSSKIQQIAENNSLTTTDLSIPQNPLNTGYLHPTTQIIRELNQFFRYYGFSVGEGPEIETVEYNFRKLNLPEGHPATDLQDTLFINQPNILLRTHTSSVEARMLAGNKPPLRVVVPGRCYRNETTNATNAAFFYQYQGFVVDKGITIQHLKATLTLFHQFLFGQDVKLRFRYKYYPEVSPGMGVDMQCQFCDGVGCNVCKQRGWIEVLGSGMIHYNTLKACGIDPEIYSGFAFGLGLDRLVMSKFAVKDIRKLYQGNLAYISGISS